MSKQSLISWAVMLSCLTFLSSVTALLTLKSDVLMANFTQPFLGWVVLCSVVFFIYSFVKADGVFDGWKRLSMVVFLVFACGILFWLGFLGGLKLNSLFGIGLALLSFSVLFYIACMLRFLIYWCKYRLSGFLLLLVFALLGVLCGFVFGNMVVVSFGIVMILSLCFSLVSYIIF